jgi:hypothetical protein
MFDCGAEEESSGTTACLPNQHNEEASNDPSIHLNEEISPFFSLAGR